MTKPMTRLHNSDTGEVIDREMTDAEFAEYKKHNDFIASMQAEEEKAKTNAEAKLAAIGLTADDLKALGL
jgi:hypothetical protein